MYHLIVNWRFPQCEVCVNKIRRTKGNYAKRPDSENSIFQKGQTQSPLPPCQTALGLAGKPFFGRQTNRRRMFARQFTPNPNLTDMETIRNMNTVFHIIGGFTALSAGLVPMLAKKGGKVHIAAGRIFFWAMMLVSFSAAAAFFIKPYSEGRLFLMFVGIFSFYLTYTGVRIVKHKKPMEKIPFGDWLVNGIAALSGLAMLALSGWFLYGAVANLPGGNVFFGIMYAVFGVFMVRITWTDFRFHRQYGQAEPVRMAWFFTHIQRILGAYIGAVTAFFVVNVHFLPPLLVWLAPGVIGGIGIGRWVAHYRKKLGVAKVQTVRMD